MKILSAEWIASAVAPAGWPEGGLPEIAFIGRSNVGKSSLLNRLVARRKLARTSATPGKTRLLHFFRIARESGECVLVDLPGYGYAKVSRSERNRWRGMIEAYLAGREALRAAVLLVDARRDPGEEEIDLVAWLRQHEIPVLLAITKADKLRAAERARRLRAVAARLPVQADWQIPTSARTGVGIDRLWAALDGLL